MPLCFPGGCQGHAENEWSKPPRFHVKPGRPLKRAVFAGKGRLRNPEAPEKS